ncbi:MAG: YqgE/AlgH family protein [Arenimonas sp.]
MPPNSSLTAHFLIAMPAMDDPNFAQGVTLLCQHNDDGAMGLMINRVSEFTVGEVLEQMQISTEFSGLADIPVLIGGPVQPDRGFVLHDDPREWSSTLRFGNGLAVSTSRDILEAMAKGEGPKNAVIALGYAGWSAGQLEAEIVANAWLTVEADQAILFRTPINARWQAAAKSLGINLAQITDYSGRA